MHPAVSVETLNALIGKVLDTNSDADRERQQNKCESIEWIHGSLVDDDGVPTKLIQCITERSEDEVTATISKLIGSHALVSSGYRHQRRFH